MRHQLTKLNFTYCVVALTMFFWSLTVHAVEVYGVYEVTLTATGSYANPYLEMPGDNTTPGFVTATFTGPNSEKITIDGFWDGGSTWKIRMAPTAAGTWSYTTSSVDQGLDSKSGSFSATASSKKGFIEVDPINTHHFRWSDGTPFFFSAVSTLISNFSSNDAQGGSRRVDDGTFQALADIRAGQGFTATFWGFCGFNKPQFVGKTQKNEGGAPFTNYDPDLLNPAYHQYGDQRVAALNDRGIASMFNIGWPDQGIATNIGHTRLKRYWRYLIARYAAYNVIWNIFGEGIEWNDDAISRDYGELTKAWDPYKHPVTEHTSPQASKSENWMDFITLQQSANTTSSDLSFNKPVINAEFGAYEVYQATPDVVRNLTWDVRMHGGYFVYESWGNDPKSLGAYYVSLINNFFVSNTQYNKLEYHPELFSGKPGISNPGIEYVTYLIKGGSIAVDLSGSSGTLTAQWYNPRTGTFTSAGSPKGGSVITFSAPDTNDWVLHLKDGTAVPPSSKTAIPTGVTINKKTNP